MSTGTVQRKCPRNPGLIRAVKIAGGQTGLARAIGRRQASVWEWLNKTGKVSAEDAIAIERATGVPAELINGALMDFTNIRGLEAREAA